MRQPHRSANGEITFGMELIMDIDGCDPTVFTDPAALSRYLTELVERLKMKAYGLPFLKRFGLADPNTAGYTAIQPIETSSIVVHASEGLARVHINVFSCRIFDPADVMDYSEQFFRGTDMRYTTLAR